MTNRLAHRTGKNQNWTEMRVRSFRGDHHVAVYKDGEREERGELTLEHNQRRILLPRSVQRALRAEAQTLHQATHRDSLSFTPDSCRITSGGGTGAY